MPEKNLGFILEEARTVIVLGVGYPKPTLPYSGSDF